MVQGIHQSYTNKIKEAVLVPIVENLNVISGCGCLGAITGYFNKVIFQDINKEGNKFFYRNSYANSFGFFAASYAATMIIAKPILVKKLSLEDDNARKFLAFTGMTLLSCTISEVLMKFISHFENRQYPTIMGGLKASFQNAAEGKWDGYSVLLQTAVVATGLFFLTKMAINDSISEKDKYTPDGIRV